MADLSQTGGSGPPHATLPQAPAVKSPAGFRAIEVLHLGLKGKMDLK